MRHRLGSSLIALTLTLATTSAAAQSSPCLTRPDALIADLGLHVVNLGYQRTLGCYVSVQASAGLYVPWTVNNTTLGGPYLDQPGDTAGFVLRARAFVYLLGTAPGGLWLSPYAQVGVVRGTRGADTLYGPATAAGLSIGWTLRLGERWLLGLGLGVQYITAVFDGTAAFPGFARFWPTADINVGFRF